MPKFPPKSFLPVRSNEHLERRRKDFDSYLKEIVGRSDTRNCKDLIRFLELD